MDNVIALRPKAAEQALRPKAAEQALRAKAAEQALRPKAAEQALRPKAAEQALRAKAAAAPEPLWRAALGEQLRAERGDRDERIADVADRAGVSPQYLSELERGRKDPSSEVLAAVAGALGLSVVDLTRRTAGRLSRSVRGPVCLAA